MNNFFPFGFRPAQCVRPFILAVVLCSFAARADVVFAWNELLLHVAASSVPPMAPLLEARTFAIAHVAMDEALIAAAKIVREEEGRRQVERSAVAASAETVLVQLLPGSAVAIRALAVRHLSVVPDGEYKRRGIEVGRLAAEQILRRRQNDGWIEVTLFNPPFGPAPDNSETAAGALARGEQLPASPWLKVAPFSLKTAKQFPVREMRTINRGGEVFIDYGLQSARLFEGIDHATASDSKAVLWSQRPIVTWNRIACQLSAGRNVELGQQARLLAVLNTALADATLSTLHWRHTVGSWRSITADRLEPLPELPIPTDQVVSISTIYGTEQMRLATRQILIPPTLNYPSLAATAAGAAQAVLARFFKGDQIGFSLPSSVTRSGSETAPQPARAFSSVSAAARECALVASFGGRYSREACMAGYSLGASVGDYVGKRQLAARR